MTELPRTPEVMVFDDVEAMLVDWLTTRLTGYSAGPVVVATKVPNPRPDRFVKVTRTGGHQRDLITDLVQVTVECWAATDPDAADLARLVRAYVWMLAGTEAAGTWVRIVTEVGGPVAFPDPETNNPRYQFTAELNIRGTETSTETSS